MMTSSTRNLTEKVELRFRRNFFNIVNHPSFGFPDNNLTQALRAIEAEGKDCHARDSRAFGCQPSNVSRRYARRWGDSLI
jgi:hypothetical protein